MGNFAENLNLGNRFRPPLAFCLRLFPCVVVSKYSNTPNWSSVADDAIYTGRARSSRISFLNLT